MPSSPTLAAWGLAAAALWFFATWTGTAWLAIAAKPVPALALAAFALGRGGRVARLLGVGLVFGALGDLFLALEGLFLPGLGSFLVGHALYAVAFTVDRPRVEAARALPFVAFAALLVGVLWPGLGDMALPVAAYTSVISAMMWRAAARLGDGGDPRAWLGFLGAGSFAISDMMIAVQRFHHPLYALGEAVMITYWLGQLGVALSAPGAPAAGACAEAPARAKGA